MGRYAHAWLVAALAVVTASATCPAAPMAVALDPGGFSIDFRGVGETPVTGDEMLVNGGMEDADQAGRPSHWQADSYVWLPISDPARQAAMLARITPLMQWEGSASQPHGGKRAMHLAMPRAAYLPSDPSGHEFCAMFHQPVALTPLTSPMKCVLGYHFRGWSAQDVPNSRPYVRVTFYDDADSTKAGQTRAYTQRIVSASERWRHGELVFTAPRQTRCLDVRLALTGAGEVYFDDVSLRRSPVQDEGPTVRLMPASYLDNLYCLSTGDAETMCFGFRNETSSRIDQPQLLLRLPAGIDILDTAPAAPIVERKSVQVDGASLVEYRLDISALKSRIHDGSFDYPYNQWDGLQLVVRTALPASASRLKASYWFEDGAYDSEARSFSLQIVPPVPTVSGPRAFRSGTHLFLVTGITKPEAVQAFAKLYRQVGLNCVHVSPSPLGTELGRLGIERYAQPFANGYAIGDAGVAQKPDAAVFRLVDGQPLWEAICPTEVYRRGPYFRERIVNDLLRGILVKDRTAEQLMCNWEPAMYVGRGCFCDRCKAEFAAYSKLPAEEVNRVWPKQVIQQYGDLWTKFRAWQHGEMMATLEEAIHALGKETGRETHFIPEVYYGLLTPTWAGDPLNREYAAVNYMDRLPVINAWAPYNWYVFGSGPYDYIRGRHLSIHVTAQEVQRFVADRLSPPKRPKLIAFPFGTFEGATQPEALAFEMMTYFLDGYHGAFAYLFPGGYDARHWRALAEMNRQMALIEPFVTGGKRADQHAVACETPMPNADPRFLENCAPVSVPESYRSLPLTQSWEFQQEDGRLVAVGNFWERGECFFRLTPRGLQPGRKYVLREPAAGRVYADDRGRIALTPDELARGVLLHAGAMRYAFFVLEPYREGTDYGRVVTPQEMTAAMKERLPAIRQAFAAE